MFRSVGSILFGIASDRYGRKWPFIVNNVLFIVLELVSQRLNEFRKPLCHQHWFRSAGREPRQAFMALCRQGATQAWRHFRGGHQEHT